MMMPHIRVPCHITALYIFAVINLTLLINITLVEANIVVRDKGNNTVDEIRDMPAKFGNPFPSDGLWGRVVLASGPKGHDACSKIKGPPDTNMSDVKWIALIERNHCDFDIKVLNAQKAGFDAAIVYNVNSDALVPMGSGSKGHLVKIPSAFIGYTGGDSIKKNFIDYHRYSLLIDRDREFDANLYLLPFAIVVGICFILMLVFMIAKWLHDLRKKRRSRISKEHLKKIPVKKFKKGDEYEMCAICLDEYEEGEKLRILPCAHAYHMKCIDPWLTRSKRLCPLCKKKVIPGDVEDSSSDSDSDEETDRQSETAPLLASGSPGSAGSASRVRGDSFDQSGLPHNLRGSIQRAPDSLSDTSSDDGSASASFYQSSVEVHQPRRHGNIQGYGAIASVTMADETSDHGNRDGYTNLDGDDDDSEPRFLIENLEGLEGAVGGMDNLGLDLVEDHYRMETQDPLHQELDSLTRSADSTGSSSSNADREVAVRNGPSSSRKAKKSKRRNQNGMV